MAPTPPTAPQKSRIGLVWVAVLSLFVCELLFYTWCRVQCVQMGYAIGQENRKQKELNRLQNNLNVELARLKAPEYISRIAQEKLALGMPKPKQIFVVP